MHAMSIPLRKRKCPQDIVLTALLRLSALFIEIETVEVGLPEFVVQSTRILAVSVTPAF